MRPLLMERLNFRTALPAISAERKKIKGLQGRQTVMITVTGRIPIRMAWSRWLPMNYE